MCEAAGISCLIGSMPELGVGTAAQIHLAVSSTNIGKHDCDTCGALYFEQVFSR
jgi:L-alanine-DL-glutamate epimerase-like enolase superfamily enzyme